MSHFPAGQPASAGTGWPGGDVTQELALLLSAQVLGVGVASDIDMRAAGGNGLLLTTDTGKGRFIPVLVSAAVNDGNGPGAAGPVLDVGFNNPGNAFPYDDWVNQEQMNNLTAPGFGARCSDGQFPIVDDQQTLSAAPGTAVYAYARTGSGATKDLRTVAILGFYTG